MNLRHSHQQQPDYQSGSSIKYLQSQQDYQMKDQNHLFPIKQHKTSTKNNFPVELEHSYASLPSKNQLQQSSQTIVNKQLDSQQPSKRPYQYYFRKRNEYKLEDILYKVYEVPSFLRVKVNDITSLKPQDKEAVVDITIFLTLYIDKSFGLDQKQLKQKLKIAFRSEKDKEQENSARSCQFCTTEYKQKGLIHLRIARKSLQLQIIPYVFKSPIIYLRLWEVISIAPIQFEKEGNQKVFFLFNLLENSQTSAKIIANDILAGDYRIIQRKLIWGLRLKGYENSEKLKQLQKEFPSLYIKQAQSQDEKPTVQQNSIQDQKQESQLPQNWNKQIKRRTSSFDQAELCISLERCYNGYIGSLLSYIGFIFILGLMSLAVFFQQIDLTDRLASVATRGVIRPTGQDF